MKTKILSILALLLMTVTQGAWAISGSGTSESPYLIASTTDWNNLVTAVNGGNTYSGKYFKMTANVGTVSTWMTGTFSGTFDGDGNTLTVGYSTSARYCAPFGTLGGTVKKLRVAGTLSSSAKNFGGIAAQVASGKTATIQNCRVSATLTSTLSGDNSSGGFVGVVGSGGTLNITGCAFTGSLQGSGATACGGFLGYKEGTCSMTDCLFAPASVTMSPTYAGTFSRPSAPTMTRCYFTRTLGTAQGLQARTIAAGDYVSSLSVTKGSGTEYTVSGIKVYSGGIDFNDGSTTTFYGGSGQSVSLDLTAATRTGYQFKQYATSQGTLSGQTTDTPTLTMPAANSTANDAVTISAEYTKNEVTLTDGDDLSALSAYVGEQCDVTYLRSFTAGTASTVCLPFAYTKKTGDGSFYAFTNIEKNGSGEYVATMTEPGVSTLTANTPYLYMPIATGNVDFSGAYTIPADLTAGETTSNGWTFKGTYETITWTTAQTGIYGFSGVNTDGISQGQFVKVGANVYIWPMRCYLVYGDGSSDYAGAPGMNRAASAGEQLPETIKVRLISAGGEVTAIGTMQTKTGEVTLDGDAWYSLDGRRMEGKPSTKGIYINNNKKVIIK